MSVTSISSKNKNLLWAVSAGRCEYIGCNKVLHTDILTNKSVIVPISPISLVMNPPGHEAI